MTSPGDGQNDLLANHVEAIANEVNLHARSNLPRPTNIQTASEKSGAVFLFG